MIKIKGFELDTENSILISILLGFLIAIPLNGVWHWVVTLLNAEVYDIGYWLTCCITWLLIVLYNMVLRLGMMILAVFREAIEILPFFGKKS